MTYGAKVIICPGINTKHTNTVSGQNVKYLNVKRAGASRIQ